MSLWSNTEADTSAPKYAVAGGLGVSANGQALYANTTIDAYVSNLAVGVEAVTATEESSETDGSQHAGWNLVKRGTGPVVSITANTGAYGANGYVTFTGGGTSNTSANATITVNTNGSINSITINSGGEYLTTPTAKPASGNAAFTVTMGGRANRVQSETLVAMGSIS